MNKNQGTKKFRPEYHDSEFATHRLPFVSLDARQFWWALPASGGYGDGCEAGRFAALAYLKAARGSVPCRFGTLQQIVFAMAARLREERNRDVVRGHIVGFFSELDAWASTAARWEARGGRLDTLTEEAVCNALQDAIDGGPERRSAARGAAERSEIARHAARARWGKSRKRKNARAAA
jgi:hypothetical protein